LNFTFTVCTLLKIFVRSRRDQEKKYRIGIRQKQYCIRYHLRYGISQILNDSSSFGKVKGGNLFFIEIVPMIKIFFV
jgi:hypothetical protein